MRRILVLAVAAFTVSAFAQSPLRTLTGGTSGGAPGGAIYFDLQINTTVTITDLEFLCSGSTVAGTGTLDIYLGPTTYLNNLTNPTLWTLVGSTLAVAVAPSTVSTGALVTPFALGPGTYGVALKSNGHSFGYTNGVTCTSPTIPGSCTNPPSTFSTAEMTLRAGAAQNVFLSGSVFSPRVFNGAIHYTPGGTPIAVAAWEPYGSGCYSWFHSFYTFMSSTAAQQNLGSATGTNSLRLIYVGTGYFVGPFNGAGTGTWFTPTSTPLPMLNNSFVTVSTPFAIPYPMPSGATATNSLEISENGYVSPAGSNSTSPVHATIAAFLNGNPRWGNWHDLFAFGSSIGIFFDIDPSGQQCYVTWLMRSGAGQNSFQLAFSNTGTVEFRWQVMGQACGGNCPTLVGWTPGGGVLDPGSRDLSQVAIPFVTGPTDHPALQLSMGARPLLGTSPSFDTANVPATTLIATWLFGFTQISPGLDLGFLGAPGCFANLDYTQAFIGNPALGPFLGGMASTTLSIPNIPSFNGQLIFGQAVTLTTGFASQGNTLDVLFSNGVRMVIGSL